MNKPKKAIRCKNTKVHRHDDGRLLAVFDKNYIYLHCKNSMCKKWTRLKVRFEGIELDFSSAAIIQDTLPDSYHFDVEPMAAIMGDDYGS